VTKLRFRISMSLDGYTAGPEQSTRDPLGIGGERLHEWVVPLAAWRASHGLEGGEVNASTRVLEEELANIGATIMGRNMFGGHPGPWDPASPWRGWWGDDPPFHHPVFVLTHHPRPPLALQGAGLVDEMELHVVPTLLGAGERLFDGVADLKDLRLVRTVAARDVTHHKFARS
jgi:dihydrofolate reductase